MTTSPPPRANVLALAVIIVVTLGCAAPLWFYRRAAYVNALAERIRWRRRVPRVRRDLCLLSFGIMAVTTIADFVEALAPLAALSYVGSAILLFEALDASRTIRRVGEQHALRVTSVYAALLTPFAPIYFQWKLNALAPRLSARGARRRGEPLRGTT